MGGPGPLEEALLGPSGAPTDMGSVLEELAKHLSS